MHRRIPCKHEDLRSSPRPMKKMLGLKVAACDSRAEEVVMGLCWAAGLA